MQRIRDWALKGFVMLREWAVAHGAERHEKAPHPFWVHDEGSHVVLGCGIHLEIGNVIAHPGLLCLVPPDLAARGIPGLAIEIAGGAIVHDAAIRRPGPGPVGIYTKA